MRRSVRWPKASNGLGNALRRMATNLRVTGIELQFSRNDVQGRRVVSVVAAAQIRKHRQLLSIATSNPEVQVPEVIALPSLLTTTDGLFQGSRRPGMFVGVWRLSHPRFGKRMFGRDEQEQSG